MRFRAPRLMTLMTLNCYKLNSLRISWDSADLGAKFQQLLNE